MARYGRLLTDAQWEKIHTWLPQRPRLTNARCPPVSFCRPIRNDVSNMETEACLKINSFAGILDSGAEQQFIGKDFAPAIQDGLTGYKSQCGPLPNQSKACRRARNRQCWEGE
jgi:hypothetical protein